MYQHAPKVYRWLRRHPIVCFLLMTVSFMAFGVLTVDLVRLIAANTDLVVSHGLSGLQDGGLQQLVELWLGALLAMVLYLVFNFCEQVLLHVLLGTNAPKTNALMDRHDGVSTLANPPLQDPAHDHPHRPDCATEGHER